MDFLLKTLISGLVIAFVSWLSGRKPVLAGFLVSLPMISILSIIFSYAQYKDMEKINQFAVGILVGVPLSLTFFIPFVLNRWLHLSFWVTYGSAIGCLVLAYLIHHFLFKSGIFSG